MQKLNKESKNTFLNKVNSYYDNNSALFLKFGVDKEHFNIHQPLWGLAVKNKSEAANYSNHKIAETITSYLKMPLKEEVKIVDLGCGVGGSLFYLQQYFGSSNFQFSGITLSQKQVDISKKIIEKLAINVDIKQGDFQKTNKYFKNVDVIYMVEAFLHSPNYIQLVEQVGKSLKSNGLFIVLDDWLKVKPTGKKPHKWIKQYKKNWLAGSLINEETLIQTCERNNLHLINSANFTSYIKFEWRNRLLRLANLPLLLLPFKSTYVNSLTGGIARQECLKQNWINYKLKVFRKI